ncbi:MAG: hypothetical protein AAF517_05115 [Planctomycetota bacterium]
MKHNWIPLKRVGQIEFESPIDGYVESGLLVEEPELHDDEIGYKAYRLYGGDGTTVYTENDRVDDVLCDEECIYEGLNVIGLSFDQFVRIFGPPNEGPEVFEMSDGPQEVYQFDDHGAQVWFEDGSVVTVICSALLEED